MLVFVFMRMFKFMCMFMIMYVLIYMFMFMVMRILTFMLRFMLMPMFMTLKGMRRWVEWLFVQIITGADAFDMMMMAFLDRTHIGFEP